jgi:hypothetical protein
MKIMKYGFYGIGVLLMVVGQFLIFLKSDYLQAGVVTGLGIAVIIFGYFELYSRAVPFLKKFFMQLLPFFEALKTFFERLVSKVAKRDVKIEPNVRENQPKGFVRKDNSNETGDVKKPLAITEHLSAEKVVRWEFDLNKSVLLYVLGVFLVLMQIGFLRGEVITGIFCVVIVISSAVVFFLKKDKYFKIVIDSSTRTVTGITAGIGILLVAWILMLVNQRIVLFNKITFGDIGTQQIAFWMTVLGAIVVIKFMPLKSQTAEPEIPEADFRYDWVKKTWLRVITLCVSAVFFIVAGLAQKQHPEGTFAVVLYILFFICLMFSMPLFDKEIIKIQNNRLDFAVKLLAVAGAFFLAYIGQKEFYAEKVTGAMVYFIASALLFIVFFPPKINFQEQEESEKLNIKIEYLILFLIVAIGLYFRVHELGIRPVGIENDEAGGVITILEKFNHVMVYRLGRYAMYLYMSEPVFRMLGITHVSIKLIGVIIGTATIPVIYFAVRYMFNSWTAIIVTLMFAVSRWHIHFSRSLHGTIILPLTVALCIYFLIRGFKYRDKWNFFLAGLAGGICWWGYRSGQLITLGLIGLLLYKLISEKKFIQRYFVAICAFSVGFWIFTSPLFQLWFTGRELLVGRPADVSVFSRDANAPKNPVSGVFDNTKKFFLMFNYQGDSRQRNTGMQPYDKTIDFWAGMFFMIGLLYSIYYWRDIRYLIFILILMSISAAGHFSLEAPSAFRVFGVIPIIYFYMAIPICIMTSLLIKNVNKRIAAIIILLCFVPVLWGSVKENYDMYFKRWVGGMDEGSTREGEFVGKYGPKYVSVLLGGSLGYTGHPPFKIWTWGYNTGNTSNVIDCFPERRTQEGDKGFLYLVSPMYTPVLDYMEKFYVGKQIADEMPAFGKFFDAYVIPANEVLKWRGLNSDLTGAGGIKYKSDIRVVEFPKDINDPYHADWQGTIFIPFYGNDIIKVDTNTRGYGVFIDGKKIIDDSNPMFNGKLYKGLHKIKVIAKKTDKNDYIKLLYSYGRFDSGRFEPMSAFKEIGDDMLFKMPTQGLVGEYYGNSLFQGNPVLRQLDPLLLFDGYIIGPPYSMIWRGYLKIDKAGEYKFDLNNNGSFGEVFVSGKCVCTRGKNPEANVASMVLPSIRLSSGYHEIKVLSQSSERIMLNWAVDNGKAAVLPPDNLFPERP